MSRDEEGDIQVLRGASGVAMLVMAGVLGAGCAPAVTAGAQAEGVAGPLTMLPACDEPPAASGDPAPPGLVVPDDTVITQVHEQNPVTSVRGYIPMTPVQVRMHYEEREDVEPLVVEDEVFEAEVLLVSGDRRMYLKAVPQCDEGSSFHAMVAPDVDGDGLPVPTGTPGG